MNVPVPSSVHHASTSNAQSRHSGEKRRRRIQAGLLDRVVSDRGAKKARQMASSKAEKDALFGRAGYGFSLAGTHRMFLALQSTIPEEVDWALTGLLHLSKERGLLFSACPGSAEALMSIVQDWTNRVTDRYSAKQGAYRLLDDHSDRETERRATNATLVLLNSLAEHEENRRILSLIRCRPTAESMMDGTHQSTTPIRILSILEDVLGSLEDDSLLELSLRSPEPFTYLLEILRMLLPYLIPSNVGAGSAKGKSEDPLTIETVQDLVGSRLAPLFANCHDQGIIVSILTVFLSTTTPSQFALGAILPKVLQLLVLNSIALPDQPYSRRLSMYCLMLLYDLTQLPHNSAAVLASPDLAPFLRSLLPFVTLDAKRQTQAVRSLEPSGVSMELLQNKPTELMDERSSLGPAMSNGMVMADEDGKADAMQALGYGERIQLTKAERRTLRSLPEPQRVNEWLKANFIYHPKSMMTQVTYWNEYRELTAFPSIIDDSTAIPRPSVAAVVIPALTQIFKKCQAVVISVDALGNPLPAPKYVVKGLMFRRYLNAQGVYRCKWIGCAGGFWPQSAEELLHHVSTHHLAPGSDASNQCGWIGCQSGTASRQHISLHIPTLAMASRLRGGRNGPVAIMHPDTDIRTLRSGLITDRKPAPLPDMYPVIISKVNTPLDERDWPKGEGYWTALILRNLAQALRREIDAAELDATAGGTLRAEIPRGKASSKVDTGELFGLPIPDSLVRARDVEGTTGPIHRLSLEERRRAREAFVDLVEEPVLEMVQDRAQVAPYLLACLTL